MYERITATDPAGPARYGHDFRYRLASGFAGPDDRVLDAACGTGYGHQFFRAAFYTGVDVVDTGGWDGICGDDPGGSPCYIWFMEADLTRPSLNLASLGFDVFVGFETIEHLSDYSTYLALAKRAKRWIIMSVPVVPTKHLNPWHVHDFEPGQLRGLLEDETWEHYQTVQQPSELSEIVVMRRRS